MLIQSLTAVFRLSGASLMAALWVVVSACSTVPVQEMSDARQTIQAARDAGAEQHALETLEGAEALLYKAERQLETGTFNEARESAISAREMAWRARQITESVEAVQQALHEATALGVETASGVAALYGRVLVAAGKGDENRTGYLADKLLQQVRAVINRAYLARARPLIQAAKLAMSRLKDKQKELLKAAETAYQEDKGKQAYELASDLMYYPHPLPASRSGARP